MKGRGYRKEKVEGKSFDLEMNRMRRRVKDTDVGTGSGPSSFCLVVVVCLSLIPKGVCENLCCRGN